MKKLFLRYPNFPVPESPASVDLKPDEPVRLIFIGSHFGRKGGAVAVWLAEMAHNIGFSVNVDIVSSLETGASSWVDPLRPDFFELEMKLMKDLPNVRHHGYLPNASVLALLKDAHFSLLPTFSDTFGFSAIESMSEGVPVIATRQGALPEFIRNGENGISLSLETNSIGAWRHVGAHDRSSTAYERLFRTETQRLARDILMELKTIKLQQNAYREMRVNAHATAKEMFSAEDADEFWDKFYCDALSGALTSIRGQRSVEQMR